MRTANENNTINTATGEIDFLKQMKRKLDRALGPKPALDGDAFSNWMNGEGKEEFILLCHKISMGELTPGLLRYAMQEAFQAGEFYGRAKMGAALAKSLSAPSPLPSPDYEGADGGGPSDGAATNLGGER